LPASGKGVNVLHADMITSLVGVSRRYAVNLLASMARKGTIHRVGQRQYAVIPPDVLYERKSYVVDPHLILDELMQANGNDSLFCVAYQSAVAIYGEAH
jgi:predicted transcriptional regulator of viral defense system